MAFYYVKSGGSASGDTGRETTARTGTFEADANNYGTVAGAIAATTAPASGDRIRCSDLHDYDASSAAITWTLPDGVIIESVDDTNQDKYKRGATERTTTATNNNTTFTISQANIGVNSIQGMELYAGNTFVISGSNSGCHFSDGKINILKDGATAFFQLSYGSGNSVWINDTDLVWTSSIGNPSFTINRFGSNLYINGCTFTGETSTPIAYLFLIQAGYGGGSIKVFNSDLSGIINASVLSHWVESTVNGGGNVEFANNLYPTSAPPMLTGDLVGYNVRDSGSGITDAYYGYEDTQSLGKAEIDTATYNNATTYDGTNEFSIQVDTTADANTAAPFIFKLFETGNEIALSTAKTVTVEIKAGASLKKKDIFLRVYYTDSTNEALMVLSDTRPTDRINDTTALAAGTATWTGTGTDYQIVVNIPSQTGITYGKVIVYGGVSLDSDTVNFDMPSIADT